MRNQLQRNVIKSWKAMYDVFNSLAVNWQSVRINRNFFFYKVTNMTRIFWLDGQLSGMKEGRLEKRITCVVQNVPLPSRTPTAFVGP